MSIRRAGDVRLALRISGAEQAAAAGVTRIAAAGYHPEAPPAAHQLSFAALVALSVGSMAAGGIFTLPGNIAATTAAGPAMIGWTITGVGMFCLSHVFRFLATQRPDLDSGVYAYAKSLMGPLPGLLSAWGYWTSAWLANLAYFVLLFGMLGSVVPAFGDGLGLPSLACASALLWLVHALILKGVRQATLVNTIATVAKVVPILVFIVLAAVGFKASLFTLDLWGDAGVGSVFDQVSDMMLVTVWVFLGIEGASVYSSRARRREDVGRATITSYVIMLSLLVLVNLLSYGAMHRARIAGLDNPSLAGVMEVYLGRPGSILVSVGLVVSLLGAVLAWQLLCAETIQVTAADGTLPLALGRLNRHGSPANAMWLTSGCMQVMLVLTATLGGDVYLKMIQVATSMMLLPYLFSALFGVVESWRSAMASRRTDVTLAGLATLYSCWLIWAGGVKYLLLSALVYLPGVGMHVLNRHQQHRRWFTRGEAVLAALVTVLAVAAAVALATGRVRL